MVSSTEKAMPTANLKLRERASLMQKVMVMTSLRARARATVNSTQRTSLSQMLMGS